MRPRKDLDQYQLAGEGSKLRYVYRGAYHVPPLDPKRLRRAKVLLLLGSALQAILVFLMGWLNFPSFRQLYVTLPFLAVVFAAGKSLLAAASLFSWQDRMTARQHQLSWQALTAGSLMSAVAGGALLLGAAVFILFGGGRMDREWGLLLGCVAHALLSLYCHLYLKRRPCILETGLETPAAEKGQDKISGSAPG